MGGKTTEMKG